jgi:hypothetical protein
VLTYCFLYQFQLLREEIDASPVNFFQNQRVRQELENLIDATSSKTTKRLEEIIQELQEKLRGAESSFNSFKCDEYSKEMSLVKSGLDKVVNDLKEFLGQALSTDVSSLALVHKTSSTEIFLTGVILESSILFSNRLAAGNKSDKCKSLTDNESVDQSSFIRNRRGEVISLAASLSC